MAAFDRPRPLISPRPTSYAKLRPHAFERGLQAGRRVVKRPLEVVLRDRVEMKVRRGVTVLVRADGEVQYAVTDLDGVARFRVREVPTVAIVIDGVESSHALAPHDGRVRRIAIER